MKKQNFYFPIIYFMLLLLTIMFSNKYVYLAPNLDINAGLLIYPFTFLLTIIAYKKYNMKYVKQLLFTNFILLLLFYLLISILNTVDGNMPSNLITSSLRNIFTPNSFIISNKFIYYPNLTLLLTFVVIYFISHFIFITVYEAVESTTYHLIAFILSIMIGFTLDQLLFIPLANIPYLIDNTLSYNKLIEMMTANFIIVIFSSIIMLLIYGLVYKKVK